jgi:hypothetical protein
MHAHASHDTAISARVWLKVASASSLYQRSNCPKALSSPACFDSCTHTDARARGRRTRTSHAHTRSERAPRRATPAGHARLLPVLFPRPRPTLRRPSLPPPCVCPPTTVLPTAAPTATRRSAMKPPTCHHTCRGQTQHRLARARRCGAVAAPADHEAGPAVLRGRARSIAGVIAAPHGLLVHPVPRAAPHHR